MTEPKNKDLRPLDVDELESVQGGVIAQIGIAVGIWVGAHQLGKIVGKGLVNGRD